MGDFVIFKTKFSNILGQNLKKELGQFWLFLSFLSVECLKHSKLSSKKLEWICRFLPWVNFVRGDLCVHSLNLKLKIFCIYLQSTHNHNNFRCFFKLILFLYFFYIWPQYFRNEKRKKWIRSFFTCIKVWAKKIGHFFYFIAINPPILKTRYTLKSHNNG